MLLLKRTPYKSILLLLCSALFFSVQSPAGREYRIKAAFIFNFTQFVEWPGQAFATPQSPAVIGILGKDPFGTYLEETIAGESIHKHPLVIRHFSSLEEVSNCHILFITVGDKAKQQEIIEKLKGRGMLTISDAGSSFSKLGGMIRLYTKNDKINIQVNLEAAKAEGLVVSSKLLKLAEIVSTDKK